MTDEVEKIKYCHVPLILRHVVFHFPSLRLRCVSSLTVYHILITLSPLLVRYKLSTCLPISGKIQYTTL